MIKYKNQFTESLYTEQNQSKTHLVQIIYFVAELNIQANNKKKPLHFVCIF